MVVHLPLPRLQNTVHEMTMNSSRLCLEFQEYQRGNVQRMFRRYSIWNCSHFFVVLFGHVDHAGRVDFFDLDVESSSEAPNHGSSKRVRKDRLWKWARLPDVVAKAFQSSGW